MGLLRGRLLTSSHPRLPSPVAPRTARKLFELHHSPPIVSCATAVVVEAEEGRALEWKPRLSPLGF